MLTRRSPARRALRAAGAAIAAILVVLPATSAGAQVDPSAATTTTLDPAAARAQNAQERKQVGGEIASLRASDDDVRSALSQLDEQLASANHALDAAAAMLAAAQAKVAAAEDAEAQARERERELADEVKQMAIEEYVNPMSGGLAAVIASDSIGEAQERQTLLGVRVDRRNELLRRQRAAVAELSRTKREAKAAVSAAERAAAEQRDAIASLESTRLAHVQLVAEVDQRLDAALGEAAALDAVDRQLATQLVSQQQQLREEALARQAAALAAVQAAAPATSSPPTTVTRPGRTTTSAPPTTTPPRVTPPSLYTLADMENVGGIYVNKLIAGQFRRLLDAATAAGLSLGGGGFRDSAAQIATRRNNCGTSDYAIYEMPASQCSPPTARPGTSMHEQGMAVDFTCSGVLIRDRATSCFVWLAANAAGYGFFNLPSEPWHWSINGN